MTKKNIFLNYECRLIINNGKKDYIVHPVSTKHKLINSNKFEVKNYYSHPGQIKKIFVCLGKEHSQDYFKFELCEHEFNSGRIGWYLQEQTDSYYIDAKFNKLEKPKQYGLTIYFNLFDNSESELQELKDGLPTAWQEKSRGKK